MSFSNDIFGINSFLKSITPSADCLVLNDMLHKENNRKEHFHELKNKAKLISSVKSVGKKTTMTLLAALPELGPINRRQIAALAGLAPFANDSVSSFKRRTTSHGRPLVKRSLFMCALVAIRHILALKAFYHHLVNRGKVKMVAIVALMRKLLIIINNRSKAFYIQSSL